MQETNLADQIRKILAEELSGQSQSESHTDQPVGLGNGIFETVDEAVAAAKQAQGIYAETNQIPQKRYSGNS